jgi:hypothetical protein
LAAGGPEQMIQRQILLCRELAGSPCYVGAAEGREWLIANTAVTANATGALWAVVNGFLLLG